MKDFLIRSFCLAAVILILAGYNQVLKDRNIGVQGVQTR